MQEEKEKMVDIDTSGPGADVELPEEKQEDVVETKEDSSSAPQESTAEKVAASDEKPEAKEQKDELQDYSKDVQRRIAKLTKKWREAERQKEEALTYAKSIISEKESLQKKYSSVEQAGVKDREARIKSGLEAAQTKLSRARESGNFADEVEAQKEIARLGYEEARLEEARALLGHRSLNKRASDPTPRRHAAPHPIAPRVNHRRIRRPLQPLAISARSQQIRLMRRRTPRRDPS